MVLRDQETGLNRPKWEERVGEEMYLFNYSLVFIQQTFIEMGRDRDKGPEELNRDTDGLRSDRKLGRQVWMAK